MTTEKFLQELLASQDLSQEQEATLQAHKKEVTDFLRIEFGGTPIIKYAGSHEKGTMIRENYDLDIVCYFLSSDERSLKEIRDDVSEHLSKQYILQHKASAERITDLRGASAPINYHIDVVPGRFIEKSKDVFLHVAYGDKERIQTNLKTHIDHISNSGCVDIIRLVKLWNCRNGIGIKTFVLELFVVQALQGSHNKSDLKTSFLKVLHAIKNELKAIRLVDPANTNNIVSDLLSASDKSAIAQNAERALSTIEDSDKMEDWKKVFNDNTQEPSSGFGNIGIKTSSGSGAFTPPSPWCNMYVDK